MWVSTELKYVFFAFADIKGFPKLLRFGAFYVGKKNPCISKFGIAKSNPNFEPLVVFQSYQVLLFLL